MVSCENYRTLLSGLLDHELTPEEAIEINDHLIRCASCRADYERIGKANERLEALSFVEVTDEASRAFWRLPYSRAVRNAGLWLIVGGYVSLLLFGFFSFLADGSKGLFGKIAGAAIVIGFVVLVGMLVIERVVTYRVDPYKEIER
jgi:predicted anti-sigma-YlaC factor YlaD